MDHEIADLLAELTHRFKSRLNARDDSAPDVPDLAPFQARLVAFLGRRPLAPLHLLAERSGRDKAQITRTIKELEAKGLVRRIPDPGDGRIRRLELTEDGTAAFSHLLRRRAAVADAMLRDIPESERQALKVTLRKMHANLGS